MTRTGPARIDPAALDALLSSYDQTNGPGLAVGVALAGRPGYRRGMGLASVELPLALSPTIRMRIGSTTKHFTVLAVLLLAEEGRLRLDEPPSRYIPELPAWAARMSLRQLMSHTSGMLDSLDLILHAAGSGRSAAPEHQLEMLSKLETVNFEPGASWNYNNGGYVLLAEVVARVSGLSFAEFLRKRVFEPVGLHDTLLRPLDTDLVPNSATLHVPSPDGGYTRGIFGTPLGGEGGIVSTVDDMLLWLRHMSAPVVGSADTWTQMRTSATTHGYGLGLFMTAHRGLDTVHHAGAVVGGACQMTKVLGHELDIILMTNGRSSLELYGLVDAIIDLCIPGLPPASEDVPTKPIIGTYHSASSGKVLALGAANGKQTVTVGAVTLPAQRDRDGWLSVPILPTDLRVRPECGGQSIRIKEFGSSDRLELVKPAPDQDGQKFVGLYQNAGARMDASLAKAEGRLQMLLSSSLGSMGYDLEPLGPTLWSARGSGALPLYATLEFRGNGFLLTTGRTVRLPFVPLP